MKSLAPVLMLFLTFALRVVGLNSVPPGWRDDEVIETTVHAQLVLDGNYPLYFIQAEGHEPIYHYLSAGWIALVGRSLFAVRLISAFFGTLAVAAAYRLTRQLFGARTALLVALLIAVSFWALMYSRTKIRHVAELSFMLLAFSQLFDLLGYRLHAANRRPAILIAALFILFSTVALYTYLAATTLFIITVLLVVYLVITIYLGNPISRRVVAAILISLAVVGFLYLPLANAIRASSTRLGVVGGPLAAAQGGNWRPLMETTITTLGMFGNSGDNEALYNIPGRPALNLVGFFFFTGGIVIACSRWRDPRYAFLLIWVLGGLAPSFVSQPAASLGHAITALPVTYILTALPVGHFFSQVPNPLKQLANKKISFGGALAAMLVTSVIATDLPDYFLRWPALPLVRYLYKANLHETAQQLRSQPPATYVLASSLSKWDRVAFTLEGIAFESPPRWVNADWATIFPRDSAVYLFGRGGWQAEPNPKQVIKVRFSNDIALEGVSQRGREIYTYWQVGPRFIAREPDMGSSVASPPFPVFIFLHLLDSSGTFVAGSDRFDVDAFSLRPGDRFIQRHSFDEAVAAGVYTVELGLYNPASGSRYTTDDGSDAVSAGQIQLP